MTILNTIKLAQIFIFCDDFEKGFQPFLLKKLIGSSSRGRMSKSEMLAIYIFYDLSGLRCFKWYDQL